MQTQVTCVYEIRMILWFGSVLLRHKSRLQWCMFGYAASKANCNVKSKSGRFIFFKKKPFTTNDWKDVESDLVYLQVFSKPDKMKLFECQMVGVPKTNWTKMAERLGSNMLQNLPQGGTNEYSFEGGGGLSSCLVAFCTTHLFNKRKINIKNGLYIFICCVGQIQGRASREREQDVRWEHWDVFS